MRFAHPEALWLLLALPWLALLLAWGARRGRRRVAAALGPRMAARLSGRRSPGIRALGLAAVLLALAALILGAARPQRGSHYATAKRLGGDVVVALDVSASMLAEDLKPNRLLRARHEISALLDGLRGDRVGLVAFAGAAFVQCPLTLDYAAARMFLDYMAPDLIPEPGTDLGAALRASVAAFDAESEGYRALILISDGEDHGGGLEAAIAAARRAGVRVFAVGIGSEAGEPIPERDAEGRMGGFKRDREGRVVLSRLHEEALRRIADSTGGLYMRAGGTLGLDRLRAAIDEMEKRELEGGVRVLYEERYRYFAWPALLLLLLEPWVPLGRRWFRGRKGGDAATPALHGLPAAMIATALLLAAGGASAAVAGASPDAPGAAAQGRAAAAPGGGAQGEAGELPPDWSRRLAENEVFRQRHPDDPRPLYNLGNLHHLRGDYEQAGELYDVAAPRWRGGEVSRVHYNLGNTLFRQGLFAEARGAYLEALRAEPGNADAKWNLELAQRMLDTASGAESSCPSDEESSEQGERQQGEASPGEERRDGQRDQERGEPEGGEQGGEQGEERREDAGEPETGDRGRDQREDRRGEQPEERSDAGEPEAAGGQGEPRPEGGEPPREVGGSELGDAGGAADLDRLQLMQLLRGLEGEERDLLQRRFQARGRRIDVEKDW